MCVCRVWVAGWEEHHPYIHPEPGAEHQNCRSVAGRRRRVRCGLAERVHLRGPEPANMGKRLAGGSSS